jgi:adenylate cyclase
MYFPQAPVPTPAFQPRFRFGRATLRAGLRRVFSRPATSELPERVRESIERLQEWGEIFVGWAQASAIVFFAAVYAISPKAFPPDTAFQPVPWTLGLYALFTAARLALAYRGRLRGGIIALSVVVDMTVLMITIWSFHLQYQTPPALYLKAPTMMYVFIFIALRTLRFEPRYVLLAGGCAALGWLGLFAYAVAGSGDPAGAFTHSYVEYATSYRILVGAEIDKILSILAVTAILALSLGRARTLLINSVAEQLAASDLSRFFAPEIARQIRHGNAHPKVGQSVRRQAAIMMVDIRGFTELSGILSAEALITLLRDYQTRLVPVIQRCGGSIDKYLGDGILVSFGAVVPTATYAADLCRTIDALAEAAETWRRERENRRITAPQVAIAGATGEVIFGIVGHETRLEYTAIGEVVNLVAKLEKHAKQEGVRALTTGESYALAITQGYRPPRAVETRPHRAIDGVSTPLDLVVLAK